MSTVERVEVPGRGGRPREGHNIIIIDDCTFDKFIRF